MSDRSLEKAVGAIDTEVIGVVQCDLGDCGIIPLYRGGGVDRSVSLYHYKLVLIVAALVCSVAYELLDVFVINDEHTVKSGCPAAKVGRTGGEGGKGKRATRIRGGGIV